MNKNQISAYQKGIKEWLEIGEEELPKKNLDAFPTQKQKEAKEAASNIVRAYCEFQDIVSGRKKLQRSGMSARQHIEELKKWIKEN